MLNVYIRNISRGRPLSDYEYVVMVNAEVIAKGEVICHKRADGWKPLIKRIIEQEGNDVEEQEDSKEEKG